VNHSLTIIMISIESNVVTQTPRDTGKLFNFSQFTPHKIVIFPCKNTWNKIRIHRKIILSASEYPLCHTYEVLLFGLLQIFGETQLRY